MTKNKLVDLLNSQCEFKHPPVSRIIEGKAELIQEKIKPTPNYFKIGKKLRGERSRGPYLCNPILLVPITYSP